MRKGKVWNNDTEAGTLSEEEGLYVFEYDEAYFRDKKRPAISLTLSKTRQRHISNGLFPFFFSLLSEGSNRALQCRILKIDEEDHFGLLLQTAGHETIGAVRVTEIK